ncbi:MAG: Hsp70 family protein [Christensenellales bacterium]
MALQRPKERLKANRAFRRDEHQHQPAVHHGGRDRPRHLDITLTRAKFDELTRDLVDATVARCRTRCVAWPDSQRDRPVILVGGSTLFRRYRRLSAR